MSYASCGEGWVWEVGIEKKTGLPSAANFKMILFWSSHHGTVEMNPTRNHEVSGSIPGLTQLRIQRCHELWCRSQTQLGSGVAVAVA